MFGEHVFRREPYERFRGSGGLLFYEVRVVMGGFFIIKKGTYKYVPFFVFKDSAKTGLSHFFVCIY